MRGAITVLTIGMLGVAGAGSGGGCVDKTPPPQDVPVPLGPGHGGMRSEDPVKPMPRAEDDEEYGERLPPPPFKDVPLVSQETPEQRIFVEAYEAVGRPRIAVFVNRTLDGELLPVNDAEPYVSVERRRTSRGDVTVESRRRELRNDGFRGRDDREATDRFESRGGPDGRGTGQLRDRLDVYLRPGQYDEALARQVDYEAVENILTDVLACQGRVEIVSPIAARRRLTDAQVKDLQEGDGRALNDVSRALDADVLIHVTARPTRQTRRGLEVRLVGEAINSRGGQSIARGVVDILPPLDKPKINRFSRFLARKLMDGMIGSWESMPAGAEQRRGARDPRDADEDEGGPGGRRLVPSSEPRGGAAPFAEPTPDSDEVEGPSGETPDDGGAPATAPLPGPRREHVPPDAPADGPDPDGPETVEADADA